MSYFDMFLNEKLDLPVEYLNPLENVEIGKGIDSENIEQDWHLLSDVVGLAQRKAGSAFMEIDLLPPSIVRERIFRKKQGVFAACFLLLLAILGVWGWYNSSKLTQNEVLLSGLEDDVNNLDSGKQQIDAEQDEFVAVEKDLMALTNVVENRGVWIDILEQVREDLPEGAWITQIRPDEAMPDSKLTLIGSFFKDKLYEDLSDPDNTPIIQYQDLIKDSLLFGEDTRFTSSVSDLSDGEETDILKSISVFQIEIELKNPVKL